MPGLHELQPRQPGVTAPIIGPSRLEHLESSLRALEIELTDQDHKRIDEICPPGTAVSNYYDINASRPLRQAVGINDTLGPWWVEPESSRAHSAGRAVPHGR